MLLVLCHLMTETQPERRVISCFCHCANITVQLHKLRQLHHHYVSGTAMAHAVLCWQKQCCPVHNCTFLSCWPVVISQDMRTQLQDAWRSMEAFESQWRGQALALVRTQLRDWLVWLTCLVCVQRSPEARQANSRGPQQGDSKLPTSHEQMLLVPI